MLAKYLDSHYRRHGRGEIVDGRPCWDCFGLARAVRHEVFGRPLMPSYVEVVPDDKRQLTRAATDALEHHLTPCELHPGAIALAWRGRVCVHVGVLVVVDGRRWILETDEGTGPQLVPPRSFAARYPRVEFYD